MSTSAFFVEVPKDRLDQRFARFSARLGKPTSEFVGQIKNQMEDVLDALRGEERNRILASLYLLLSRLSAGEKIGHKQFETYFKFGFVRNPWGPRRLFFNERHRGATTQR